jgi:hypothetical protein
MNMKGNSLRQHRLNSFAPDKVQRGDFVHTLMKIANITERGVVLY